MKPNRLTLEQLARIADAVLRDPNVSAAAIARELGTTRSVTWAALNRLRRAGRWFTKLVWRTCAYCGQPLAAAEGRASPKLLHTACKTPWDICLARERKSRLDPEHAAQVRERDRIANRSARHRQWCRLSPEAKQAALQELRAVGLREQELTAPVAVNAGSSWTAEEDAFLLANRSRPNRETALVLGRSYRAVGARLSELRRKGVDVPPSTAYLSLPAPSHPIKHQPKPATPPINNPG